MRSRVLTSMAGAAWLVCVTVAAPGLEGAAQQPPAGAPAPRFGTAALADPPAGALGMGGATVSATQQKVTGTVIETIDSAGYTYLRLQTGSGEVWAAVMQTKVRVGATVTVLVAMTSDNFESKSLKRTFAHLILGNLEGAAGAPAALPGHGAAAGDSGALLPSHGSPASGARPAGLPKEHPAIGSGDAAVAASTLPKAAGANGRTVAEIWHDGAALKDRQVVVRGKVVKFLDGIMGRNWLHLRDGSGVTGKGNDDITVTTNETAAVGDVIVVTGTVRVDQDFGAGYRYTVMIADAKLAK